MPSPLEETSAPLMLVVVDHTSFVCQIQAFLVVVARVHVPSPPSSLLLYLDVTVTFLFDDLSE